MILNKTVQTLYISRHVEAIWNINSLREKRKGSSRNDSNARCYKPVPEISAAAENNM